MATIPLAQKLKLNKRWMVVCTGISYREKQIDDVASSIKTNLMLIGATSMEGKMQEQVNKTIEKLLELRKENLVGKRREVTEGKSLNFILLPDMKKKIIDLCSSCKAGVCWCRVSPIQKAELTGGHHPLHRGW